MDWIGTFRVDTVDSIDIFINHNYFPGIDWSVSITAACFLDFYFYSAIKMLKQLKIWINPILIFKDQMVFWMASSP